MDNAHSNEAVNQAISAHLVAPAPHGYEDDGYAIEDDTSRFIAAMEREYV